ncbi:MAG TPA: FGGY family carbohydrate kinase [Sphingomonas sp.]|nr:FGGY family carbohydrate kinase [Sphingomonas sp.]
MTGQAVLAVDQGTSNTKAVLVGRDGAILARASRPMAVAHPRPGWAEQSAAALWESVAGVIGDLVAAAPEVEVAAVGISNQRETAVLWDAATGEPVAPAILWQCRRTAPRCEELRAAGYAAAVVERSGLGLDPLFPAAKIAWLLDTIPEGRARADRGELRAGTVDSWLLWKLTGGAVHATDLSNASRTQLLNLESLAWDAELARIFGVPLALMPEVRASDSRFGTLADGATALPAGVPICAMMGDSHAALYAHGARSPGEAKVTCGTGSSLMVLTQQRAHSAHGLSSTIAWAEGGHVFHALEGNITTSGAAAAFATQLLGLADEAALTALAETVGTSDGVCFVPALAGLGAPHWNSDARGMISGMSLGTRPAHVARAALEGIAHQIADVFEAAEADLGHALPTIVADGGAAKNVVLMHLLADLLGRAVVRPENEEASVKGVARMAAKALGWENQTAAPATTFQPRASDEREAMRAEWKAAIARASFAG